MAEALSPELEARVKRLVNAAPVMLFLQGTPTEPEEGPSKVMLELLKNKGVLFSAYNVRDNADVARGVLAMAAGSSWPLLFIQGRLALEVVADTILDLVPEECRGMTPDEVVRERCLELVQSAPVMVFIKGTVDKPRCGFTNKLLTLLMSRGILFDTFDILSDEHVRAGLKKVSNWNTYPQLYVNGVFVGGLDICTELDAEGGLLPLIPDVARAKKADDACTLDHSHAHDGAHTHEHAH